MKEVILKSLKLYGKCIVGSIMCFILVITLNVIGNALFTDTTGYTAVMHNLFSAEIIIDRTGWYKKQQSQYRCDTRTEHGQHVTGIDH